MKFSIPFIFLGALCFSCSKKQVSAKDIVKDMYHKYEGKWYKNITFEQMTSFYNEGNLSRKEIWYEAMSIPDGLIIKTGSMQNGNGLIFKNDSIFVFRDSTLVRKAPRVHDLLVLGFSIYFESPEQTISKLNKSGFDLAYLEDQESHYIIGNPKTKQVWIEKDRLIFIKLRSISESGNVIVTEFNKYEKLGDGWIAPEVLFYRDSVLVMKEEYSNILIRKEFSEHLFDEDKFVDVTWK